VAAKEKQDMLFQTIKDVPGAIDVLSR